MIKNKPTIGTYCKLPGNLLVEVTKIDQFGVTEHIGVFGKGSKTTNYFSGWIPSVLFMEIATEISRDEYFV